MYSSFMLNTFDTTLNNRLFIFILLQVEAQIYFCESDGACYMQGVMFKLPVTQQMKGGKECDERPVKIHYDCIKP